MEKFKETSDVKENNSEVKQNDAPSQKETGNSDTLNKLNEYLEKNDSGESREDTSQTDNADKTKEKFEENCKEMGVSEEDIQKIKDKNGTENPDGSYTDKETGKTYPSFEDWYNQMCANRKKALATAETYKKIGDREWARYKNCDDPDLKYVHRYRATEAYDRAKACEESAAKIEDRITVKNDDSKK